MLENIKQKFWGLFPEWFIKLSAKMKLIVVLLPLIILGVGSFLYPLITLAIVATIVGLAVVTKLGYFKIAYDWLLNSWRDTKLLSVLFIASVFQFYYPIHNQYLDRLVDIGYIAVVFFVLYNLFSLRHGLVRTLKWLAILPIWFLSRAFHHGVDVHAVEQFFNIYDLVVIVIVIGLMLAEKFWAKKDQKVLLLIVSSILIAVTFVFSAKATEITLANKRMHILKVVPIDKKDIKTFGETAVDEALTRKFFSNKNDSDEKTEDSDLVWYKGKQTYVADYLDGHKFALLNPVVHSRTKGVRTLQLNKDLLTKFKNENKSPSTHAIHSTGKWLGDNTLSAAAKALPFEKFFITSFDGSYKKCDEVNNVWYSIVFVSELDGYINPLKIPTGIRYIKHDENETYNFLWGASKYIPLKEVVEKLPFMKGEPIISPDVVTEFAASVEYKQIAKKIFNRMLVKADKDEDGNINVETLYAEIKGYKGQFARVEFIPKSSTSIFKKDNKTTTKKSQSFNVQKVWYFPLFYTGLETGNKKVVVFEDTTASDGVRAKSALKNDFNEGLYSKSNGYDVFAATTIIRNGKEFILVALVNNNGASFNENITFKIKGVGANKTRPQEVRSEADIEKFIALH